MCGRYSVSLPPEQMARLFGFAERPNLEPRWNVAPTQDAPIVRADADGKRHLVLVRWGLVPAWAKDLEIGRAHV
jgi:putative SOS response-associated peptidase YedK